jgi:CDGSH-type Zn-finger protein
MARVVSTLGASSPSPRAVRLPSGLEQPVTGELVQALELAGAAARRSGRVEADLEDLIAALAGLPPERDGASSARVTPYRDGPYLLRGAFELTDQDGNPIATNRRTIALCRCGRSQLRPFCDGTHKLVGFQAESGAERPLDDR